MRCGNLLDNASASSRAATSVGPPAAKGTTRCSVVAGQDCACAEAGARPDGTKRAIIRKDRVHLRCPSSSSTWPEKIGRASCRERGYGGLREGARGKTGE